jgi:hypothetical protein
MQCGKRTDSVFLQVDMVMWVMLGWEMAAEAVAGLLVEMGVLEAAMRQKE